jgi:hypothetical protein
MHRLTPRGAEVEDGQAPMGNGQPKARIAPEACIIGPTMAQSSSHAHGNCFKAWGCIGSKKAGKTTHDARPGKLSVTNYTRLRILNNKAVSEGLAA